MTVTSVGDGRYELGEIVGTGGMALVFRARDRQRNETVAVKLLADNLSADPELRERFRREAELARRLSHENVVRVVESGETDGRAFIVLEYMAGGSLADQLARTGRPAPEQVAVLGAQAAAGLAHAHDRGLVHRDVKPQNLLLTGDGTLKVSDFGVARALDGTRLTAVGTVLGTAAYLAPEQGRGEPTTSACDVYALGVVLRELLGEVPAELEGLVSACLRHDPSARPAAEEVERVLRGETVAPTRVLAARSAPRSVLRRKQRRGRRRGLGFAAGAVVAAAVALALGVGLGAAGGGGGAPRRVPVRAAIPPVPGAASPAGAATAYARWLRARAAH